jgi:ammonia channel protein AmtB
MDYVSMLTAENAYMLNSVWVLVAGILVFFMQAGFALYGKRLREIKKTR